MSATEQEQLEALASHLKRRRDPILQIWRERIASDPELITPRSLDRRALDDHIPRVLDNVVNRLRAEHEISAAQIELQQRESAAQHSLQRWHLGYHLREAMREWEHLQQVLLAELGGFAQAHPDINGATVARACQSVGLLIMEAITEGSGRHDQMRQAEATDRARALQRSIDELQEMENERAARVREVAHDLRGSAAVIANVSALLKRPELANQERQRFYELLQRRIQTMGGMLSQLMDWARLESGEEALQLEVLDVAERIRGFCELMLPLAEERGLSLQTQGIDDLHVQSDAVKLLRILQNLLLNAIHATAHGGITVAWGRSAAPEERWSLLVQDTGPGLPGGGLVEALIAAQHRGEADAAVAAERVTPGEGMGLLIVERLCEVLQAQISVDSARGQGTSVRISFPLDYRARDQ